MIAIITLLIIIKYSKSTSCQSVFKRCGKILSDLHNGNLIKGINIQEDFFRIFLIMEKRK